MLLLGFVSTPAVAAEAEKIVVSHDRERFLTTVLVPGDGSVIAWSDVVRGLARARDLDDTALDGLLPEGSFDVSAVQWRLAIAGMNLALKPHVQLRPVAPAAGQSDWALEITLDQQAMLASARRFKNMLRNGVIRRRGDLRQYGIEFQKDWGAAPAALPLVIIVHGLNSSPEDVPFLVDPVRESKLPAALFRYPNDQALDDSAALLSRELKALAERHPQRKVILLTHSMGGLIARACIENQSLDPGNVTRLIMVAPPNHGSQLAHFAFAVDVFDYFREAARRDTPWPRFYEMIEDGLSEAARDLTPDSPFLRKLDGYKRNAAVRYSILLGTRAPMTREQLDDVRQQLADAAHENRFVKLFGKKLDGWLADMEEVVDGQGDGAVSVSRGRLEGVEDTLLLPFDHLASDLKSDGVRKLQKEIVSRLVEQP